MTHTLSMAATVAAVASSQQPDAPKLLLVDDDRSVRRRLQQVLETYGFAVTVAEDFTSAEELIAEDDFDFAVVDLVLNDGHGLDLIKTLKTAKTPPLIVIISGYDSFASTVLALKAGATDYLPKPIDEARLLGTLRGECIAASIPDAPLTADRVRWEHVQRIFEQCRRNVSDTARQLGMHRRTLQRMLRKHAPRPHR